MRDELINKWSTSQQHIEDEANEDDHDDDGSFPPPVPHSIQAKTAKSQDCEDYNHCDEGDKQDEPSSQLLTEQYASLAEDKDDDELFVQIPTPDASSSASKPRRKDKKKNARDCGRVSI